MRFDLVFNVAGDDLIAGLADGTACDTDFARVTVRRQHGEPLRLAIAGHAEPLPEVQTRSNPVAARVAEHIQTSANWIRHLECADIRLQGSPTELRCSVATADTHQENDPAAFEETTSFIVSQALNAMLSTQLPLAF